MVVREMQLQEVCQVERAGLAHAQGGPHLHKCFLPKLEKVGLNAPLECGLDRIGLGDACRLSLRLVRSEACSVPYGLPSLLPRV